MSGRPRYAGSRHYVSSFSVSSMLMLLIKGPAPMVWRQVGSGWMMTKDAPTPPLQQQYIHNERLGERHGDRWTETNVCGWVKPIMSAIIRQRYARHLRPPPACLIIIVDADRSTRLLHDRLKVDDGRDCCD